METLFFNGSILTMAAANAAEEHQQQPEAVLVRDGRIVQTGTLDSLKAVCSSDVEMHDLQGACLAPAFIDPHSHFVTNGQLALCVNLSDCNNFDEIRSRLLAYIAERNITEDQAVFGFGYDHNFLAEGTQPDKTLLDTVSQSIPILIMHVSLHLGCANSAALQLANISAATPNPEGGVIGRLDSSNEPSGYLEEMAVQLVQKAVVPRMKVNPAEMFMRMQDVYLENGITTVQDGATTANDWRMLLTMAGTGMLKLDVVAFPLLTAEGADLAKEYASYCDSYQQHVKIGGYKLVLDGSPQGRSAWMSQPYLNGAADYCGYPWLDDDAVYTCVMKAIQDRRQLLAHCNGDAASEQFLRAYEKAVDDSLCNEPLRPVMIHCQTVRNDQLDRMKKLDMIASIFVGHVWYWGDVHLKNFGSDRGHHISPAKDALTRGLHVTFHQDTPVTKPDMLHSIWCAVNRISRNGNVIGENQKIDVYDALRAVTTEAAYQYFEESSKGCIKAGYLADLIILDKSPLEVEPMSLREIKVMKTFKEGTLVYQRR